jgi:carbon-monoxide dehydrogenase medium subunit
LRPFAYHYPATLGEAVAQLGVSEQGKVIAGGQSLIPSLRLRLAAPTDLVDIAGVHELRGIHAGEREILVGALARHCEVAASPLVMRLIPALARLAAGIGDRQVRNLGTLGGSLANNDPAACYPAAALALGATINTSHRAIAIEDFLCGLYQSCLADDELIVSVNFPIPKRAAYVKFHQPASRFALVGVFVAEHANGIRVAVTGAGLAGVFRATGLESALLHSFSVSALKCTAVSPHGLSNDIHASAEYRAHLIGVLAQRAVLQMTGAESQ